MSRTRVVSCLLLVVLLIASSGGVFAAKNDFIDRDTAPNRQDNTMGTDEGNIFIDEAPDRDTTINVQRRPEDESGNGTQNKNEYEPIPVIVLPKN